MSNFFISTGSMSSAARASALQGQEQLVRKQKEIATGKIADVGLVIGHRSRELVGLRQALDWSRAISGTNAIVATKLEATQTGLADIEKIANGFLEGLLAARASSTSNSPVEAQAGTSLTALLSRLNSEVGGEYVFGGGNVSQPPLVDYFSKHGSPARTAVQRAFHTHFSIASSDPAVSEIDGSSMRAFLDTELPAEFSDAAWSSGWSKSSDDNPIARIGWSEMQEVGANANEAPFRQLAMALVMVSDLGGKSLNADARAAVLEKATELVGSSLTSIVSTQSRVGLSQERIASANEQLSLQIDIVSKRVSQIEDVDPYATATELNELMSRLEASYATTARIQRLSLLDYL